MRRRIDPTTQTVLASSAASGIVNSNIAADPATSTRRNVTISVTATYTNDDVTDTSSVQYTLDGVSYTTIHSESGNGSVPITRTDVATLGNVDITNLELRARAFSSPASGVSSAVSVTAWFVAYEVPGIIQAE